MADDDIRPGEIAVPLPAVTDVGVYFIGKIRTPWATRSDCPRSGDAENGPECTLVIDPRWREALTGLNAPTELQVLYWMHQSRRDLAVQAPRHNGKILGTFALRSPVRPNPIASSVVTLLAIEGTTLRVRGLDCMDGTPLIDLKPYRRPVVPQPVSAEGISLEPAVAKPASPESAAPKPVAP
jgi:tRNA-Thr(GGU) m(6)t(6)A37 methyltransferase TsaA